MKQLKSINVSKVEHYEFPGLASLRCGQDLEFGQIKTEFRKKAFLLVRSNGSRHLILFQGQQLPEDHVRRSSKLKMQLWNIWWTLDLNYLSPFDSIFMCIESLEKTWLRSDKILMKSSVFIFLKKRKHICAIDDYCSIPIFSFVCEKRYHFKSIRNKWKAWETFFDITASKCAHNFQ